MLTVGRTIRFSKRPATETSPYMVRTSGKVVICTANEAIGAYNFEKHNEIITIVDKNEYQKLMNFINREDPKAFVTIYNVSSMHYQPKR